jgi:hypothetical protein
MPAPQTELAPQAKLKVQVEFVGRPACGHRTAQPGTRDAGWEYCPCATDTISSPALTPKPIVEKIGKLVD